MKLNIDSSKDAPVDRIASKQSKRLTKYSLENKIRAGLQQQLVNTSSFPKRSLAAPQPQPEPLYSPAPSLARTHDCPTDAAAGLPPSQTNTPALAAEPVHAHRLTDEVVQARAIHHLRKALERKFGSEKPVVAPEERGEKKRKRVDFKNKEDPDQSELRRTETGEGVELKPKSTLKRRKKESKETIKVQDASGMSGAPIATTTTSQYGDNITSKTMDVEKTNITPGFNATATSATGAGSTATGGAAASLQPEQQEPITMIAAPSSSATGNEHRNEQKTIQDDTNSNPADVLEKAPEDLQQTRSNMAKASTHILTPPEYADGSSDPYSLIGKEIYKPVRPHPSQHLISLYGVSPLAASVARFDPVTGEKINRLRKSYEGHLRHLQLAGRNKAIKHERDPELKNLGLEDLAHYPAEEWQIQRGSKYPLHRGWTGAAGGNGGGGGDIGMKDEFRCKLERALRFENSALPPKEENEWSAALGIERTRQKGQGQGQGSAIKAQVGLTTPNFSTASNVAKANGVSRMAMQVNGPTRGGTPGSRGMGAEGGVRPRRAGKKRSYHDSSFEGYGEGYVDDDHQYSDNQETDSNEGSKNGRKKRRKESGSGAPPPQRPQGRVGGYGPGVIHQAGIGTYGR